jgi:LacI family repressor for deo operon, udp, cdd, tsx, nupC, and nupG
VGNSTVAVTLRDVARHAGVSTRTVSNVVNDFHHVSPAMRAKVQAALDELNYRPNLLARGLRQGRTGIITLLLPEIAVPYFGELAHELVERAGQLGFTLQVDETGGSQERELRLLDIAIRSQRVDGVLLSCQGLYSKALAQLRPPVPVVLLGERTAGNHDHVGIDNVAAAREATQHLLEAGHTRVAAVGGSDKPSDATSRLRIKGYRAAMRAAGLPVGSDLHAPTPDYSRAAGAVATRALLARPSPPQALLCFSDLLAAGALRELNDQGVGVPDQMSVVGFDDVESSRFSTPSLSSVAPDKAAIAGAALDMLIERMEGSSVRPRDVRVPHRLVLRESSTVHVPH